MIFDNFKKNRDIIRIIKNSIEMNRLPSVLLISGEKNTSLSFAEEIALYINCLDHGDNRPCRECRNCIRIKKGNFPDVNYYSYESYLVFAKKKIKKVKSIGIEQSREITNRVFLKPFESASKIFILDNMELYTTEAQNALLKTIEEPPEQTYIMILTERQDGVLSTIKSRSWILNIAKEDVPDIEDKRNEVLPLVSKFVNLIKNREDNPEIIQEFSTLLANDKPQLNEFFRMILDTINKEMGDLDRNRYNKEVVEHILSLEKNIGMNGKFNLCFDDFFLKINALKLVGD